MGNILEIQEGQVWRKEGAYDWLKVLRIQDPRYPNYDDGAVGCSILAYPPQLKGIQLRGGSRLFIVGDWEAQIKTNRFLYKK